MWILKSRKHKLWNVDSIRLLGKVYLQFNMTFEAAAKVRVMNDAWTIEGTQAYPKS